MIEFIYDNNNNNNNNPAIWNEYCGNNEDVKYQEMLRNFSGCLKLAKTGLPVK